MTSEKQINALLAELWQRNQPLLEDRLSILDRAAIEVKAGAMNEATRIEALDIAHKLAGTLGLFGCNHGTDICREIEKILGASEPAQLARLPELAIELREALRSHLA